VKNGEFNMKQIQRKISTKIGDIYLVASENGLQGVFWDKQQVPMDLDRKNDFLNQVEFQLNEYLDGKRKKFDILLDMQGSEFQMQVWKQLMKIPYGETRAYKDIAKAVNDSKASRAIGTANRQNPLCIVIPCHRVISSDGSLGGYSGGINIKKILLKLEKGKEIVQFVK
jgi:methylated-DNA-[protein]-cysteine S-methyltransferase